MKVKFSNKNWVLLSTALVIGLAFSIYFLVYVKSKEKAIISNNFRVLQQIVSNIKSLEQSYLKNAEIISKSPNSKEVNQNIKQADLSLCAELKSGGNDTTHNISYTNKNLFFRVKEMVKHSDRCNYYFTPNSVFFNNELFLRQDIFDQIIVMKVDEKAGEVIKREIIYSNKPVGIMDSTFFKKTLRAAKDEISINDKKYISFNQRIEDDQNIFISALILKSDFEQQKRSVSPFAIFTLSILLILIILAMPLLKLKIMSNEERLYIKDVVFSVVSVLIGPAVFMVFLYISFTYFGSEKTKLRHNLEMLSSVTERNFRTELGRLVKQIDDLNNGFPLIRDSSKVINRRYFLPENSKIDSVFVESDLTVSLQTDKIADEEYARAHSSDDKIYGYRMFKDVIASDSVSFKHLKAAFWSTDQAKALVMLSAFHRPSYAQNLSHRKYLTNIIDGTPDVFHYTNGKNYKIAVESIKSVNDGSYEIGVGKSTGGGDLPVLAISTKPASVMGTIIEEGYGFCILDSQGNTMFHSDITKNMNENFIDETAGIFEPAMHSQTGKYESVNYNGRNQLIYFRPMNCLSGHYIATFVNEEVLTGPLTISMISCFIFFLSYLLIILFVYMAVYYSSFKGTKLKQAVYLFNFLRPYETEYHYSKYKRLIILSTVFICYLILSSIFNADAYDFLISDLLYMSILLLIFTFYSLSKYMPEYRMRHINFQSRAEKGFKYIAVVSATLMLIRLGHYIVYAHNLSVIVNALFGYLLVLLIILEVYTDKKILPFNYPEQPSEKSEQIQSIYKLYLFLWVIILSVIPVNLFLRIAQEKENSIFSKYRSIELLNKISDWDSNNKSEFADKFDTDSTNNFDLFINSMRQDSINFALTESKISLEKLSYTDFIADSSNGFFDKIYSYVRPDYDRRSSLTENFINNYAEDSSWFFTQNEDTFSIFFFPNFDQNYSANVVSIPKYNFLKNRGMYILIITLISVLILLKFLSFTIDRIYGFAYKNYALKSGMDQKTFGEYFLNPRFFSNSSSYNNIFIVGVNASNTFHIKNYLEKHYKDDFLTLDFYDFDDKTVKFEDENAEELFTVMRLDRFDSDWTKIKSHIDLPDREIYVLIEHFEFGYNDFLMNKLKLEALKYIVDCKNFKVLISSEINATKLLDFYDDSLKRLGKLLSKAGPNADDALRKQFDDMKVDFKKWQHLLGSFVKCIVPINKFPNEEELAHGEFLDMVDKYLGDRKSSDFPQDDKILTIQQMSYPYYFSVWNSLSKDERYIIYDIAKDKFVNTINVNGILSLLDKGILVYDHSLRIMNDSFANFVLTKVNSDEALEMEMESRKKGTWNTAFAVLFLLIISLVIFLSIGQQNFLNDINAFLTAIAALIGLLIRFSGFFSFGASKGSFD